MGQKNFSENNPALSRTTSYGFLTVVKIEKKMIQSKKMYGRTDLPPEVQQGANIG